jgi:hypothetical protein
MRSIGIQLVNTSIIGASISVPVAIHQGFQGVLVVQSASGLDPAITNMTVALAMGSNAGSGYVVIHSSKVISNGCALIGSFPAGEYVVRTLGGSSVVGAFVGIYPTP